MNDIKVPKKGGGMGAEIDILATNRKKNIWVEVSVSTNPRCNYLKENRFKSTVAISALDFRRKDKAASGRSCPSSFTCLFRELCVPGRINMTNMTVEIDT